MYGLDEVKEYSPITLLSTSQVRHIVMKNCIHVLTLTLCLCHS